MDFIKCYFSGFTGGKKTEFGNVTETHEDEEAEDEQKKEEEKNKS